MSDRWAEIWDRRSVGAPGASGDALLEELLRADGFDTAWAGVDLAAWRRLAREVGDELGVGPGDSVHEVGCGAGAFLLPFAERGLQVGGIDRAAALVDGARRALPGGDFAVGEADALAPDPRVDVVVSFGVFFYFPDLAYVERVIAAMAAKARRGVAILDLPDLACRDEALRERMAAFASPAAYEAHYAGLDHLYFDRGWVRERLVAAGFPEVTIAGQSLAGYDNGRFRFNAVATRGSTASSAS